MLNGFKYAFRTSATRPAFVVGTGQSGTHWLGYSLGGHPEVTATIEKPPMFTLSTDMALNPALEEELFERLVAAYRSRLFRSFKPLYLDKSHPNIWIAEKLKKAFPQALFIGIERDPYATVASMLRHHGVLNWHKHWREYPIPNRFLGITLELAAEYEAIPLAAKCAMRWVAHRKRMLELKKVLGEDLMVISYERFAHETEKTMGELKAFLGLHHPMPLPEVNVESLDKWKEQLSDELVADISGVVGFGPST